MKYAIYEGNMERLEKKMTRIQKKCRKYGCDFTYREVGEEFRELEDAEGGKYMARFVIIEAEGVAVVNGWKFIASVQHTEKGNIINRACDIEVPERYYISKPVCEHCNSKRYRKDTYIIMDEETGEFKQVGKSCLKDFTHGMSAEAVAEYTAAFESIIEGESPYEGCHIRRFYDTEEFIRYTAETIRHFGYVKNDPYSSELSTADRTRRYYEIEHGGRYINADEIRTEMEEVNFNADSQEAAELAETALEWLAAQEESSNYMHNLKTVAALRYIEPKNAGILVSLFPTYNRELEREAARKATEEQAQASEWVGNIGDRITVEVEEINAVTGWETQWGYTKIYKIVDKTGNVFTWKTSGWVEDGVQTIKGTVKAHNEFRGTKQTELTRCKVTSVKTAEEEPHEEGTFDLSVLDALGE